MRTRASAVTSVVGELDRRDRGRTISETALDTAPEDRNDADEQNGNKRNEKSILGDRDTVVIIDEPTYYCANSLHRSPLWFS